MKPKYLKAVSIAIALAAFSSGMAADDEKKGPPPKREGGGEIDPRLGSTSIQMGSVVIPDSVSSCGTEAGYTRLVCLADLLKSTASDELLELMLLPYSIVQGQNWSNLPAGAFPARPGALLGEFSTEQLGMVKAIMMEAASLTENEGFDEMVQTLNADDYIGAVSDDTKAGYSSYNTKFAFLGTPAATGTWQLYYGGHHFAFTNTYTDGAIAGATPSLRGIEPFPSFEMNDRDNAPLTQERDALSVTGYEFIGWTTKPKAWTNATSLRCCNA